MNYTYLKSPVGDVLIAGDEQGLRIVEFCKGKKAKKPAKGWSKTEEHLGEAKKQLEDYFQGRRKDFDLKLNLEGTPFQKKVLGALQKIPYGKTVSYGDIAKKIGKPKAARAVGMANGRNPIPIIIPCHRVIGANGALTGFSSGLDIKKALLKLEGVADE